MLFRTPVETAHSSWRILPCERMLFVGSCFADNIGQRFREEKFRATVNPFGVMYNPASVLHSVERVLAARHEADDKADPFRTAVITLGTNHVYRLKETGEIVDNCQKRPQSLFDEQELTADNCATYLRTAVERLRASGCKQVVMTVSPIRYRKYGFHRSQLSKAVLLTAAEEIAQEFEEVEYFPAYEIVLDELRDYRFYQPDMIHPSAQAVDYIYERFADVYFAEETRRFLAEWKPIREALAHRPFNPESEEYKAFLAATRRKAEALKARYPSLELDV